MDPNKEVGKRKITRYLSPDWSIVSPTKRGNATHEVAIEEVTYADGRIVQYVLGDGGARVSAIGTPTYDEDIQRAWKDQQAQANREQGGVKPTNVYVGTNPTTGKPTQISEWPDGHKTYDDTQVPASATTQSQTTTIEGTPRSDGTWDNTQPREVTRGANGQLISSKPLEGVARQQWERERNQAAGKGPYTDQQIVENATKNQPTTDQGAVTGYPGWTYTTAIDAAGNKKTVYTDPQGKTQPSLPEKPDAPTKPTYQTIKGGDGQEYIRSITIGPDGKTPVIKTYGPQGQEVASIPGEKEAPKVSQTRSDVDGQVYTTVTTISPDNKITVQTVDQQGKPVDRIPMKSDKPANTEIREINGEPREIIRNPDGTVKETRPIEKPTPGAGAGPPLPQIVVGMSQAALRAYKEQLQAEVAAGRQTQTWANARWEEATQMATFAVQEATLQQREYETNLNANVNMAQSRLSYLSTGMGQALNFALSINDKLPPGSDLGGKAFAAILGLQSINMARSGINDIKTSPTDTRSIIERSRASNGLDAPPAPSSGPSIRIANPGNPQAVEQQRQDVVGQLQDHIDGISNTTDAGGVPREYTPASSTNGASGQPPAAAPASPPSLIAGPTGTPAVDTGNVSISPDGSTAVAPSGATAPVDTNRPLPTAVAPAPLTGPDDPRLRGGPSPAEPPLAAPDDPRVRGGPAPNDLPLTGPNDPRLQPQSAVPAAPDLAVMAKYQPGAPAGTLIGAGENAPPAPAPLTITDQVTGLPPQQPQIQVPQQAPIDPNGGGGEPLAMLKHRLLNTPPWRMDDQMYQLAVQNGLEEDFWRTPGRSLVNA